MFYNMAGIYRYRVEPQDVDFTQRITLAALGHYILRTAGEDADRSGFGVRELNGHNCSWVLSRMAVELERQPERYEPFDIQTWVCEYGRLMTTRNFLLLDDRGECFGAAVTHWAMIDLDSRQPMDLRQLEGAAASLVDREPPIDRPRKVAAVEADDVVYRRVVYSDIDFNRHVNSMKYLEWMVDRLPLEILGQHDGVRFDINYLHEGKYGRSLAIACRAEAQEWRFDVKDEAGVSLCRASIRFR